MTLFQWVASAANQKSDRLLVRRIERRAAHRGKLSNEYDLTGLVERLKKLEPEFKEVEDMKKQVRRRGGLKSRE